MRGESWMPSKAVLGRRRQGFEATPVRYSALGVLLSVCALSSSFAQQPDSTKRVAVKAAHMIDTKAGTTVNNAVVLIQGDKITAAGSGLAIPAGVEVIELGSATILPGLIDMHTHVTSQPQNYYEDLFRKSPIDVAILAHVYAQRTLEAGFTTIRDVGAGEFIDVALRNAINNGDIPGPRMQVATLTVGSTGGHGDITGFSPYLKFGGFSGIADGEAEIRKLIRFEIKSGADLIKLLASAGVLSEEESVGAPQFTQEEMNAVVDEAH